jgi:hypothetical protein
MFQSRIEHFPHFLVAHTSANGVFLVSLTQRMGVKKWSHVRILESTRVHLRMTVHKPSNLYRYRTNREICAASERTSEQQKLFTTFNVRTANATPSFKTTSQVIPFATV